MRRLFKKHIVRRWHSLAGHRYVQDDLVTNLDLCWCGVARIRSDY